MARQRSSTPCAGWVTGWKRQQYPTSSAGKAPSGASPKLPVPRHHDPDTQHAIRHRMRDHGQPRLAGADVDPGLGQPGHAGRQPQRVRQREDEGAQQQRFQTHVHGLYRLEGPGLQPAHQEAAPRIGNSLRSGEFVDVRLAVIPRGSSSPFCPMRNATHGFQNSLAFVTASLKVPRAPRPAAQSCPRRRAGVARDEDPAGAVGNSSQPLKTAADRPQIVRTNRISYPHACSIDPRARSPLRCLLVPIRGRRSPRGPRGTAQTPLPQHFEHRP